MAYRANQQLRDDISDYRYNSSPSSMPAADEKIVRFGRQSARNSSPTAPSLVQQAADLFESMENQARETEARAQSLCKSALERLELAEKRIEIVERERREAINKLRDASKALEEAQSRIIAVEDRLTAAEFRAQAAETDAREAKQALALVEEAIRSRLLSTSPKAGPSLGTVV